MVRSKTFNPPGYKYGSYRIWGDLTQSRYYQVGTYEASQLLRGLAFATNKPIGSAAVEPAQALQTMRSLTPGDTRLLEAWCRDLPLRARRLCHPPRAAAGAGDPAGRCCRGRKPTSTFALHYRPARCAMAKVGECGIVVCWMIIVTSFAHTGRSRISGYIITRLRYLL